MKEYRVIIERENGKISVIAIYDNPCDQARKIDELQERNPDRKDFIGGWNKTV